MSDESGFSHASGFGSDLLMGTQPSKHEIVLKGSYSSWFKDGCARKFILKRIKGGEFIQTHHTAFGYAWEEGVISIAMGEGLDKAIYKALLRWDWWLERLPKTMNNLVNGLEIVYEKWQHEDWQVYEHKGRPASQLGFKILMDYPRAHCFVGFLDLVLQDNNEQVVMLECKSTSYKADMIDQLYQHDPQQSIYSLVVSAITEKPALQNLYVVCSCPHVGYPEVTIKPYSKDLFRRTEALVELRSLYDRFKTFLDMGVWPQNGNYCKSGFGLCAYWNDCNFPFRAVVKTDNRDYDPDIDDFIDPNQPARGKYDIIMTYENLLNNLARYT